MSENFAFLCGASRSGTTLLKNLLDGHQGAFVSPVESLILYYWNLNRANNSLESFFKRDFLNSHPVLWLTDANSRRYLSDFMLNKHGRKEYFISQKVDRVQFVEKYLTTIETQGLSMRSVFLGLFKGMCPPAKYDSNSCFIEKSPFDNELGAVMLGGEFPNAKFVHIIRDPRTRYNSAKGLRTRRPVKYLPFVSGLYGKDFATGIAQSTMVTMMLAKLNKEILKERYLIILYEDLIKNPESVMRKVANHLGLEFNETLLMQTTSGEKIVPNSSFDKDMLSGIKDTSDERLTKYFKSTSCLERKILHYFTWEIAKEFNYDISPVDKINISDLIFPLKLENPYNFCANRLRILFNLRGNASTVRTSYFHDLLCRFYKGDRVNY